MKSMITTAALTGVLAISRLTNAFAWSRNGCVSGPRGTNTFNAQGSCSGNSCSRSATATGAYGRTTTGPAGNSMRRSSSFSW